MQETFHHEIIPMDLPGSQPYAALYTYFLGTSPEMDKGPVPCVIVCPGGGYEFTSDREAEIIAYQFMAKGISTCVLRYSVKPAVYPTALLELAKSVLTVKKIGPRYGVDPDRIFTIGFSAGGHLVASFGNFWTRPFISEALGCQSPDLKIRGQMLGYPVITSGPYAHVGSFKALLGDRYQELKDSMSLENSVSKTTPPTFIWATQSDDAVPVQNSLMFVDALEKAGVICEFHMYPFGVHGLSLGTANVAVRPDMEVPHIQGWIRQAAEFIDLV